MDRTPVGMMVELGNQLLFGLTLLVYGLLGGIALLSLFGFLYALLQAL